jgi:Flp pilus assembly protein TadG
LGWSDERQGFTLAVMVLVLTVLMGCAALAVDAALMYSYRGQLQRTADATALAGAVALGGGAGAASADTAIHYAALNTVGTSTTTLSNGDVVPGTWTQGGGFVATGSWTSGGPFAVKTTTRYGGTYVFARLFGFTSKSLTASAVAVRGSVGSIGCVRPWAVPYQDLLDKLGGGFSATSHDLTAAEVTQLAAMTLSDTVELNQSGTDGAPHQMRAIRIPPQEYAASPYAGSPSNPSASVYRSEISEDCATLNGRLNNRPISVDDWLVGASGQMTGPTEQGVNQLLCGDTNTCPAGTPPVMVNVAIWDRYGASPHGLCTGCYHVKYMGVFYVTGYNHSGNSVKGYFSGLIDAAAGGFVAKPGPISKNALVE